MITVDLQIDYIGNNFRLSDNLKCCEIDGTNKLGELNRCELFEKFHP